MSGTNRPTAAECGTGTTLAPEQLSEIEAWLDVVKANQAAVFSEADKEWITRMDALLAHVREQAAEYQRKLDLQWDAAKAVEKERGEQAAKIEHYRGCYQEQKRWCDGFRAALEAAPDFKTERDMADEYVSWVDCDEYEAWLGSPRQSPAGGGMMLNHWQKL